MKTILFVKRDYGLQKGKCHLKKKEAEKGSFQLKGYLSAMKNLNAILDWRTLLRQIINENKDCRSYYIVSKLPKSMTTVSR